MISRSCFTVLSDNLPIVFPQNTINKSMSLAVARWESASSPRQPATAQQDKLHQGRFMLDIRKYFFTERVVQALEWLSITGHHPWKHSRNKQTWHLVLRFSWQSSDRPKVGLGDLGIFLNLNDFVIKIIQTGNKMVYIFMLLLGCFCCCFFDFFF